MAGDAPSTDPKTTETTTAKPGKGKGARPTPPRTQGEIVNVSAPSQSEGPSLVSVIPNYAGLTAVYVTDDDQQLARISPEQATGKVSQGMRFPWDNHKTFRPVPSFAVYSDGSHVPVVMNDDGTLGLATKGAHAGRYVCLIEVEKTASPTAAQLQRFSDTLAPLAESAREAARHRPAA